MSLSHSLQLNITVHQGVEMDQGSCHEESLVNLLTLPTELLVYIISFLSSLRDRIKLRYVSRWLRCVIEGTPLLWKEFVWPYYDSREECSVREVLKLCGQHIKMLSFPNHRVPSTPVYLKMLQYCSNVRHLSLPSTKLDPEQIKKTIHHMGCLQTIELNVDDDSDIKQLFLSTGQLRELTINSNITCYDVPEKLLKHWMESQFRPSSFNVIAPLNFNYYYSTEAFIDSAAQLTTIPNGTTANFRLYGRCRKVPLDLSPALPCLQLQVESKGCNQVTIPFVKLSDFGILGLKVDLAVATDIQYSGRTMCMVKYDETVDELNSLHIARLGNLSCATHFDFSDGLSLHSGHLEQLAIACPNLQRLNLQDCHLCLKSLQGLQAIASHCHSLQGLNLLGICVLVVEDHILFGKY
ncbi:uncharacterized protein [Dysidea avara]|uniref:uncharacterized protein isoform X2 n=1 Tax=Dysidea avara TaxID=196820 RepID=UPI0033345E25